MGRFLIIDTEAPDNKNPVEREVIAELRMKGITLSAEETEAKFEKVFAAGYVQGNEGFFGGHGKAWKKAKKILL